MEIYLSLDFLICNVFEHHFMLIFQNIWFKQLTNKTTLCLLPTATKFYPTGWRTVVCGTRTSRTRFRSSLWRASSLTQTMTQWPTIMTSHCWNWARHWTSPTPCIPSAFRHRPTSSRPVVPALLRAGARSEREVRQLVCLRAALCVWSSFFYEIPFGILPHKFDIYQSHVSMSLLTQVLL